MAHILVVDDETALCRMYKRILERAGHTVETAQTGAQGLAVIVAAAGRIKLALVDLEMPGMFGDEMIAEVRGMLHPDAVPKFILNTSAANPPQIPGVRVEEKMFRADEIVRLIDETLRGA